MLNDNDPASWAELEDENRRLRLSLSKCQKMVAECREKLVSDSEAARGDGAERRRPA